MKKTTILSVSAALLLSGAVALNFVSCSGGSNYVGTSSSSEGGSSTEQKETKYSVGDIVTVDSIKYFVVGNNSSSAKDLLVRSVTADSTDAVEITKAVSVERANLFAQKFFKNPIVLLRVSGKVTVPKGEKETYISSFNAVTSDIPEGLKESDFFNYNSVESDKNCYYRDTYLIISQDEKKLGTFEAMWSTATKLSDGKKLDDLLKDYQPLVIRKTVPNQYKVRDVAGTLLRQYFYTGEVLTQEKEPILYYSKKSGEKKPSAFIQNDFDSDGSWKKTNVYLLSVYGSESTSPGFSYKIKKETEGYSYQVDGSSDLSPQTKTDKVKFKFDESGKYTAENIDASNLTFSGDATRYNGREQAYNDAALSIPVDFILNSDGSVSLGEKIYDWMKAWRAFIVENNEGSAIAD